MNAPSTSTPTSDEPAAIGSDRRLVRPRRKSPNWKRLWCLLDEIFSDADNEAICQGFVKGKTKRLDAALARIEKAANEARQILRPNKELRNGSAVSSNASSANDI